MTTPDPARAAPPPPPPAHAPAERARGVRRGALVASRRLLPLTLLFAAYFFHGGALGKWRDDYFQCSIDPATGHAPLFTMPWDIRPEFWRPVHLTIVYTLGSWLWQHDALRHLITLGAAMLAIIAWYSLYRRITRSPLAASLGASLFAFYPMGFEVAFWPAAMSTALALALLAWILRVALSAPGAACPRRRLAWLAPLAFFGACLNEQPIAGLAPIGLVILAARPAPKFRRAVTDALIGTFWAGLGCLAYIIPFLATRNPAKRGGLDTLAPARDIPAHFAEAAREWFDFSLGAKAVRFVDVGWTQALPVLRANPWLVALALLGALLWLGAFARPTSGRRTGAGSSPESSTAPPAAAGPLLAFAALASACMLLPIAILADHAVAPRMTYPGAAMLGLALAVIGGLLLRRAPRVSAVVRAGVALLALALAVAGAGSLLGMQHIQHRRAEREERLITELRRLAPDPPEDAAFVPLEIQSGLIFTRDPLFNAHNAGLFGRRYCAQPLLRRAYRRPELLAGAHTARGEGAYVPLPSGRLILNELKGSAGGATPAHVTAARVIPFIVDPDGRVRLVSRLFVERADHHDFVLDFPLAGPLAAATGEAPVTLARGPSTQPREPSPAAPTKPLTAWVMGPGASVVGAGLASPGARRPGEPARDAIRAQVRPGEVFRHLADVQIPPANSPRRVLVRASAADLPSGVTLEVRWVVPERGNQVLGALSITPGLLASEPRWFPVRFNIAPGETPLTLRLEARSTGGPAEVFATPGFIQDLAPGGLPPALGEGPDVESESFPNRAPRGLDPAANPPGAG